VYVIIFNSVSLSHVALSNQTLPYIIEKLKAQKYSMVTVAECLGDSQPYPSVGPAAERDVRTCLNALDHR
jgi:hypothetical protein